MSKGSNTGCIADIKAGYYLEDYIANMGCDHRACNIADNGRNSQLNATTNMEHSFTNKGNGSREILQNNSNTICTVGHSNRQAQDCKKRHSDNSTSTSQCVNHTNQNTR